jgi:hypothetical protein
MSSGSPSALAMVRVARGQPAPAEAQLRAAIAKDRERLRLPAEKHQRDLTVAGPYSVTINGQEFDEYVVWER